MKKYKADIIFWLTLLVILFCSYQLKNVVLPFYVALGLAYIFNPLVKQVQKVIKNRVAAVTVSILSSLVIVVGVLLIFTGEIVRDVNRLSSTFSHFKEVNSKEIDETADWVKEQFGEYVEPLLNQGEVKLDSLSNEGISGILSNDSLTSQIDIAGLESIYASLFSDSEKGTTVEKEKDGVNWILVFLSSIGYFLYIIYTWGYFETRLNKIFISNKESTLGKVLVEVKTIFKLYLKQKGLIVLIYMGYFILSFYLLGLPGALIIGVISGLLCFVQYLQYLMLLPIAICCIILNLEGEFSYLFYLSISAGIFILGTLIEELLLIPRIFKQENSINPAVLMISIAVFGELMGLFGIMLAVPMTILIKSYLKRFLLKTEG